MKPLQGLTELWRFPIMGEETWVGVDGLCSSNSFTLVFHLYRRTRHDPSTQQSQNFPKVQP